MKKTFTAQKITLTTKKSYKKGFCVSMFINNVFFAKTCAHTKKEAIEELLELEFYSKEENQYFGWGLLDN